jgi:uncharacterized membrane protein YedE/YeeE
MEPIVAVIAQPWPWYVAGPLIGILIPVLLLLGNKRFGVSSSFRHVCAATVPARIEYLRYDWKAKSWNLFFVAGIVLGAFVAATFFANPTHSAIQESTLTELAALGIPDRSGLVPTTLFSWSALTTLPGFVALVVGGFLVGFGARYAGGCTSGHGIMGLAALQKPSLLALLGFFAGGLLVTHVVLPLLLGGGR